MLTSHPVSANDWTGVARLQNHIASRGRMLIPSMRPDNAELAKGVFSYAFWMVPSYNTLVRRWRVSAQCDGELIASFNGGADVSDAEPGLVDVPRGISFDEVLGSQSSTEFGAVVELDSDGDTFRVDSIDCVEIPRAFIADDASELGVDLAPFRSSQPIRADLFGNVYAGAANADAGKRVHFQWAVPYAIGGSTTTLHAATTSSPVFADMMDVAKTCVSRKLYNDGTKVTNCNARVFAWVSSGGSGEVRVTTYDGSSSTITITDTSPTWSSAVTDVQVLSEYADETDGIGDNVTDSHVQVEFRATAGTLYVASAAVYE